MNKLVKFTSVERAVKYNYFNLVWISGVGYTQWIQGGGGGRLRPMMRSNCSKSYSFSVMNDCITEQSINFFGPPPYAMSVFKYNSFRFYVIHDDQMLINILKKSLLELHKDSTMILLYQFLDKLKTACLYP